MKYWCMPDVLVPTETSPLFPHPLFNREMTDVMTLLSMIGEVEFNSCERDVRHWSHHHTGSFSYYFPCLIHFSSMKNLCIQLFWFLVRALLFFSVFFVLCPIGKWRMSWFSFPWLGSLSLILEKRMFIIGALTLQEVFLLVLLSFLLNLSHFRIIFFLRRKSKFQRRWSFFSCRLYMEEGILLINFQESYPLFVWVVLFLSLSDKEILWRKCHYFQVSIPMCQLVELITR